MDYVALIGATLTLILGVVAIIKPILIGELVSIQAVGKLGVSEIRATYGGFFFGLALFAIYTQELNVYLSLGFGWVGAAIIRACTLFIGNYSVKNLGGVIFELTIGLMCISPLVI